MTEDLIVLVVLSVQKLLRAVPAKSVCVGGWGGGGAETNSPNWGVKKIHNVGVGPKGMLSILNI